MPGMISHLKFGFLRYEWQSEAESRTAGVTPTVYWSAAIVKRFLWCSWLTVALVTELLPAVICPGPRFEWVLSGVPHPQLRLRFTQFASNDTTLRLGFSSIWKRMNNSRHWRVTSWRTYRVSSSSIYEIILKPAPRWTISPISQLIQSQTERQLTQVLRGRGEGSYLREGAVTTLNPLLGETTDCLYKSHKFPKDNTV